MHHLLLSPVAWNIHISINLMLAFEASNWQYDRKCSFYFNCYFSTQLQQTETSDRKLYILTLTDQTFATKICQRCTFDGKKEIPYLPAGRRRDDWLTFHGPGHLYIICSNCDCSHPDPDSSFHLWCTGRPDKKK